MSFAEVQKQALTLNVRERAQLVASLLQTLPVESEVSDEDALQRDRELENGAAEEISHEELVQRVEAERSR